MTQKTSERLQEPPAEPGWYFRREPGRRWEAVEVIRNPYPPHDMVVQNRYHSNEFHPVTEKKGIEWQRIPGPGE